MKKLDQQPPGSTLDALKRNYNQHLKISLHYRCVGNCLNAMVTPKHIARRADPVITEQKGSQAKLRCCDHSSIDQLKTHIHK